MNEEGGDSSLPDESEGLIAAASTAAVRSAQEVETAPWDHEVLAANTARPNGRRGLVRLFPHTVDEPLAVFPLQGVALLGRNPGADIRLDDAHVSRRHATLTVVGSGLRVSDVGSRHGTYVDGEASTGDGRLARPGSIIRVGGTLLMFTSTLEAYARPLRRLSGSFLGVAHDVWAGPALATAWNDATQIVSLGVPALVLGESGSGKEIVARLIHRAGGRRGPFVALNVATIPEGLFESELFGHVRGAFTGATTDRCGAFRNAEGGVLFLDEVAELGPRHQVKLLRAIEERVVRPLGSDREFDVDARLVAATSRELSEGCERRGFRSELYYRLAGLIIRVPPLRARRDEIMTHVLARLVRDAPGMTLSVEAAELLLLAPWEGNVRQLHHAIAHAILRSRRAHSPCIRAEHLPNLQAPTVSPHGELTADVISAAMMRAGGNASLAAKALKISRGSLYNACKREGLPLRGLRGR